MSRHPLYGLISGLTATFFSPTTGQGMRGADPAASVEINTMRPALTERQLPHLRALAMSRTAVSYFPVLRPDQTRFVLETFCSACWYPERCQRVGIVASAIQAAGGRD
jgi:hypothetical protein